MGELCSWGGVPLRTYVQARCRRHYARDGVPGEHEKRGIILDGESPPKKTPERAVEALLGELEKLQTYQDNLQLDHALRNQIYLFVNSIKRGSADLRPNAIAVALDHICSGLYANLKTRLFLFVPYDKARHYNNIDLFGVAAYVFLKATPEMLDAGNCYAFGLPTACVFHLTRVSEYGLRALAYKLKVSLRDKRKQCPIEYATWNKVLNGIDSKLAKLRQKASGPKKNVEVMFYSDAAEHCRHIRDLWRNEASHTRTRYNELEAFAAMNRIADFMQLLAKGLYTDAERQRIILNSLSEDPTAVIRSVQRDITP